MPINNLLEATRQLNALRDEVSSRVTSIHLARLDSFIESRSRSYSWDSRSPECQIAIAIVQEIVDSGQCPTGLLPQLIGLARRANIDASQLIARAADEGAWHALRTVLGLKDSGTTSQIVGQFCKAPNRDLAEAIVALCSVKENLDLEKRTFAAADAGLFAKHLSEVLSVNSAHQYLHQWLLPEHPHFLTGLDLFMTNAKSVNQLHIFRSAAAFMERRWQEWNKGSDYYRDDQRRKAIENDYVHCRQLLAQHDWTRNGSRIVEVLDALTTTPFHAHRALRGHAETLARLLHALTTECIEVLRCALHIVPPGRIHPAALRYVLARSPQQNRQSLLSVFQSATAALNSKFEAKASEVSTPIFDPDRRMAEAYDPASRIWPKNHAIVTMLFTPLKNCRDSFVHMVSSEWHRDEDSLSERLVMQLFHELKNCANSPELCSWISERYKYGELKISEPYVRDPEREWGADIGLVVKYDVEDALHHEWCYLIQAKKAQGPREKPTRWDIDLAQLDDLLLTTSAGFYLLYSPLAEAGTPYVLPARAVRSALEAVERCRRSPKAGDAKSIPYSTGRDLGKSWVSFFLEDVIGAWSGDFDQELLCRMKREGDLAQIVFEVSVSMGRQQG